MRGGKPRVLEESRGESMVCRSGGRGTTIFTDTVDGTVITLFELYVAVTAHSSGKGTVRGGDHAQSKREGMSGGKELRKWDGAR